MYLTGGDGGGCLYIYILIFLVIFLKKIKKERQKEGKIKTTIVYFPIYLMLIKRKRACPVYKVKSNVYKYS